MVPEIPKLSLSWVKLSLWYPGSDLGDPSHRDGDSVASVDIDRGHADGHRVETQSREQAGQ